MGLYIVSVKIKFTCPLTLTLSHKGRGKIREIISHKGRGKIREIISHKGKGDSLLFPSLDGRGWGG